MGEKEGDGEGGGVSGVAVSVAPAVHAGDERALGVGVDAAYGVSVGDGAGLPGAGGSDGGSDAVSDGGSDGGSLADEPGAGVDVVSTDGAAEGPDGGALPNGWGLGFGCTNQSDPLSLVSRVFPADPPGRRSMLDLAGGAGAGDPST